MGKHILLWLILIAVCVLLMPAISTPTRIMNRVIRELDLIESALGKAETARVTKSATEIYSDLFVNTGLVEWTNGVMVSEAEKKDSEQLWGQSVRKMTDQSNSYVRGFWTLCYASMVRLVIFFVWLPYIAPFFLAVLLDAAVTRKIKFASFGYASAMRFSVAAHMLIIIFFLPILYLVVPLPVTPLFIPFWALISALPMMTVVSNMQRM